MDALLSNIASLPLLLLYTLIVILIYLENTIPFLPGDAVLIFTAYLSTQHIINIYIGYILSVVCGVVGFVGIYYVGARWGRNYFLTGNYKIFKRMKIQKADAIFHKYGSWALGICRFIPGLRFFVAIIAGSTHNPFMRSFLISSMGIILWNGIVFFIAYLIGNNWMGIKILISQYNHFVIMLLTLVMSYFLFKYFKRRGI